MAFRPLNESELAGFGAEEQPTGTFRPLTEEETTSLETSGGFRPLSFKEKGEAIKDVWIDKALEYADKKGLHPGVVLSVMKQESGLSPEATSPTGVRGLMQVTLPTGRKYKSDLTNAQRYDPDISLDIGTSHLAELVKQHNGDYGKALMAYNGGSDPRFDYNVSRHIDWANQQIRKRQQAMQAAPVPSESQDFREQVDPATGKTFGQLEEEFQPGPLSSKDIVGRSGVHVTPEERLTLPEAPPPIPATKDEYTKAREETRQLADQIAQLAGKVTGPMGGLAQMVHGRTEPLTQEEQAAAEIPGRELAHGAIRDLSMGLIQPPKIQPETGPMTGVGPTGGKYTIPGKTGPQQEAQEIIRAMGGYLGMILPVGGFIKTGGKIVGKAAPEIAGTIAERGLGAMLGGGAYGAARQTGETIGQGQPFSQEAIHQIAEKAVDDALFFGFAQFGIEGVINAIARTPKMAQAFKDALLKGYYRMNPEAAGRMTEEQILDLMSKDPAAVAEMARKVPLVKDTLIKMNMEAANRMAAEQGVMAAEQEVAATAKPPIQPPAVDMTRPAAEPMFTPEQLKTITHEELIAMPPEQQKAFRQQLKEIQAAETPKGKGKLKKATAPEIPPAAPPAAPVEPEVGVKEIPQPPPEPPPVGQEVKAEPTAPAKEAAPSLTPEIESARSAASKEYEIPIDKLEYRGIWDAKMDVVSKSHQFAVNYPGHPRHESTISVPFEEAKAPKPAPVAAVSEKGKPLGEKQTIKQITEINRQQKEFALQKVREAQKELFVAQDLPEKLFEERWETDTAKDILKGQRGWTPVTKASYGEPKEINYIEFEVPDDGTFKIKNDIDSLMRAEHYFKKWPIGIPGRAKAYANYAGGKMTVEEMERLREGALEGKGLENIVRGGSKYPPEIKAWAEKELERAEKYKEEQAKIYADRRIEYYLKEPEKRYLESSVKRDLINYPDLAKKYNLVVKAKSYDIKPDEIFNSIYHQSMNKRQNDYNRTERLKDILVAQSRGYTKAKIGEKTIPIDKAIERLKKTMDLELKENARKEFEEYIKEDVEIIPKPEEYEGELKKVPPSEKGAMGFDIGEKRAKASEAGKTLLKEVKVFLAPESISPEGKTTALALRKYLAEMDNHLQKVEAAMAAYRDLPELKTDSPEFLKIMDKIEKGAPAPEHLQPLFDYYRQISDAGYKRITEDLGKTLNYLENRFPHIWDDPTKAQTVIRGFYNRSLKGSTRFFKQRKISDIPLGVSLGLKLKHENFIDAMRADLYNQAHFIAGQEIFNELKKEGVLKFYRGLKRPPQGWAAINDSITDVWQYSETDKGLIKRGEYYAPEEAAKIINEFLSPGLKKSIIYRGVRSILDPIREFKVAWSGFHYLFVPISEASQKTGSGLAQGTVNLVKGNIKEAKEAYKLALKGTAFIPTIIGDVKEGSKILEAMIWPDKHGASYDLMAQQVIMAGGRGKYQDRFIRKLSKNFVEALKSFPAPFKTIRGLTRTISLPLMEYYVPRIKLAAFSHLAKRELAKLSPDASLIEQRQLLADIWDHIDNVHGQLVYDNLNFSKNIKSSLFLAVNYPGWNIGSLRTVGQIGKGAVQIGTAPLKMLSGGKLGEPKLDFKSRLSLEFAFGLLVNLAIWGTLLNYTLRGEWPQNLKDLYFVRTGGKNPDGSDERVNLPSYLKDWIAWPTHPIQTLSHKVNLAAGMVWDLIRNQDYYGTLIRTPGASIAQQAEETAKYTGKGLLPFSYQQVTAGRTPAAKALGVVGITKVPASLTRTETQKIIADYYAQASPRAKTHEQAEKSDIKRQALNLALNFQKDEAIKSIIKARDDGKITKLQEKRWLKDIDIDPLERRFSGLPLDVAIKAFAAGTFQEKDALDPLLNKKYRRADKETKGKNRDAYEKATEGFLNEYNEMQKGRKRQAYP